MYQRSNRNLGINTNVSLEPSANTQTSQKITNNIIVKTTGDGEVPDSVEDGPRLRPVIERSTEVISNDTPIQEEPVTGEGVDAILLGVYKNILLSQNKQLLANILSKHHIMIYKDDLEKVISNKIGKKCSVVIKEVEECGCTAKFDPFAVIDSIVIYEGDKRVDFKVAYNADYVELSEKYALSLKICLI